MDKEQNKITIREAVTKAEVEHFWQELHEYHTRDMFPEPQDEARGYFLSDEYRDQMQRIHERAEDRCYYLFFYRDTAEIGFAMPVMYDSEDGKCFLMEFCVYPQYRGKGTGGECARVFLEWAKEHGAGYTELNCDTEARIRFWSRSGFRCNGRDEWGIPLMMREPENFIPVTVELLKDPEDWQLMKLMNGYLAQIGEKCLTDEKQELLKSAIRDQKITFFLAKRGYRAVGMCSVTTFFSTCCCGLVGTFEDFYIEPVFRGRSIAALLTAAATDWCRKQGISSMMVTCAPCDETMYQHLGFCMPIGRTFAHPMGEV